MTKITREELETKTVAELVKISNNLPHNARVAKRQIVQWKESKAKLVARILTAADVVEPVKTWHLPSDDAVADYFAAQQEAERAESLADHDEPDALDDLP